MGRQKSVEATGGKKVSQAAAMRDALGSLGMDASNKELERFIRDHHGLIVKNISVLKSNQKKTLQEKGMPSNGDIGARSRRRSAEGGGSNTLQLIQQLADRVGGLDELAKLVDKLT